MELFAKEDESCLRQKERRGLIFFSVGLVIYLLLALTFFFLQTRESKNLYLSLEIVLGVLAACGTLFYLDVVLKTERATLRLYFLSAKADKQEKTLLFLRYDGKRQSDAVVFEDFVFQDQDKNGKEIETHFLALPKKVNFCEGHHYRLSFYRNILTAYQEKETPIS
jgi:hypothetical protein